MIEARLTQSSLSLNRLQRTVAVLRPGHPVLGEVTRSLGADTLHRPLRCQSRFRPPYSPSDPRIDRPTFPCVQPPLSRWVRVRFED